MRRTLLVTTIVSAVSLLGLGRTASADSKASTAPTTPTLEPPQMEERIVVVDHGPNRLLLATGIATFGFAYGVSGWVGLTTDRPSERWLIVPLAGPVVALGTREPCGEGAAACEVEPTYKALLVADAILQLGGAAQIAAAFAVREMRESDQPLLRQTFSVVPSRVPGGAALFAQGTF